MLDLSRGAIDRQRVVAHTELAASPAMVMGDPVQLQQVLVNLVTNALEAMTGGRVHAALVHGRAGRLPRAPAGALRVPVARWRVGVASRGSRPRPLEELFARRVRVVQREDGASAQAAFVAAAASAGSKPPPGPRLSGHIDVARKVADGAAAGVTMETAVEGFVTVLRSTAFTARLACIGGYEL